MRRFRTAAFHGLHLTATLGCLVAAVSLSSAQQAVSVPAQQAVSVPVQQSIALKPVAQANRIAHHPDLRATVALPGHRPSWAIPANLSTNPVDTGTALHLTLVLSRAPAVQAAFVKLLADQQTPGSSLYHHWLTPAQVGTLYGPTQADVDQVTAWAGAQGMHVDSVAPSRVLLEITTTVSTASAAFHTGFSYYRLNGEARLAADNDPLIPAALSQVIAAVSGLADVPIVPMNQHHSVPMVPEKPAGPNPGSDPIPEFTNGSSYFITPGDFAVIYDVASVYAGGNTGATVSGKQQHIAIADESDLVPQDIADWAARVGISAYTLNTIQTTAIDPGLGSSQGESTLDAIRTVGSAPGAVTDLLIAGPNQGGVYVSAAYNVNVLLDPILTISWGTCELNAGPTTDTKWDTLFSAAAAEGISVFVSSGDSGAAACDAHGSAPPATQFRSTSAFCASTYATCVGGTQFADTTNPTLYWAATNSSARTSALSYILEGGWNEPTSVTNGVTSYFVRASTGGASLYIAKPSWQTGPGVPNDGQRDEPDVALSSSGHDGYYGCYNLDCETGYFEYFSGTSAAAPGMAAIAALLNTKAGTPQGNLNPLLYRLFNSPAAASIFHDTTVASSGVSGCTTAVPSMCNNSLPGPASLTGGLAGYSVGTGYDLVTGLGSLDVANFLRAAVPVSTALALTTSATTVAPGQAVTFTATLTPAASSVAVPTGTVQFFIDGTAFGTAVSLGSNDSAATSNSFTVAGIHAVTATYSGDTYFSSSAASAVQVVVLSSFTIAATPASLLFTSGATSDNTVTASLSSPNGFAGSIALICSISASTAAFQPSCAVSPSPVTLAGGGTSSATVTILSTMAQASLLPPATGVHPSTVALAGFSGLAALLLALFRRRSALRLFALTFCFVLSLAGLNGCSSSKANASPTPLRSSAGTYTVTINGSGTQSGTSAVVTASTTFAVTIQ
jgi:pseudomonalisin